MKAVLIGNGTIEDYDSVRWVLEDCTLVICADGGYNHAKAMGVVPDLIIGDMDSVTADVADVPQKLYPVRKDCTDGELAVSYALEQGADELVLLGFTGTRLDHTLTNIFLLQQIADAGKIGVLVDAHNEIYLAGDNTIKGQPGDLISIVPLTDLHGIVTEGLEYPLYGETLYFGKSRGVSNVMMKDTCRITVESGTGLIMKSRD